MYVDNGLAEKQELITSLTDLNCNSITTSDLKLNGNIYLNKIKYFDTIVIRRVNETTAEATSLRTSNLGERSEYYH